jgi:hypothetical protein
LHFIDRLVEVPLEDLNVVLFGIHVAFGGELGDFFIAEIVLDFPLLIFAELVKNFEKGLLSVREVLDFTDFAKDPSLFVVFAIDEAVDFGVFEGEELVGGVMTGNELVEIDVQFEGVN